MANLGATSLAGIRAAAEALADMQPSTASTFVTVAQANAWINSACQELYGLLTEAYGENYFFQSPNTGFIITTDGVSNFFNLPTDFFKLLGVDVQIAASGQWVPLKPFTMAERNRFSLSNSSVPQAGQSVRLFYAPRFTPLLVDGDSFDGINGFDEFVIAQVAKKMLMKEESDASGAAAIEAEQRQRIEHEAANRDAGNPTRVADTRGRQSNAMMYRLVGNQIWLIGNAFLGCDVGGEMGGGWV